MRGFRATLKKTPARLLSARLRRLPETRMVHKISSSEVAPPFRVPRVDDRHGPARPRPRNSRRAFHFLTHPFLFLLNVRLRNPDEPSSRKDPQPIQSKRHFRKPILVVVIPSSFHAIFEDFNNPSGGSDGPNINNWQVIQSANVHPLFHPEITVKVRLRPCLINEQKTVHVRMGLSGASLTWRNLHGSKPPLYGLHRNATGKTRPPREDVADGLAQVLKLAVLHRERKHNRPESRMGDGDGSKPGLNISLEAKRTPPHADRARPDAAQPSGSEPPRPLPALSLPFISQAMATSRDSITPPLNTRGSMATIEP